jgi:hypothetical protein
MPSAPTTTPTTATLGVGSFVSPEDEDELSSSSRSRQQEPPLLSKAHVTQSPPAATRRFVEPDKDPDRHNERKKTAVPVDGSRNIILPLDSLISFLCENFSCKKCRVLLKPGVFGLDVFGLACGINFNCKCGTASSLRSPIVNSSQEKLKTLQVGQPLGTRVNAGDFHINRRFFLGLQLSGNGRHDSMNITGLLNLNARSMYMRWTEIQEILSKAIIRVGKEVLQENLQIVATMRTLRQS